MKKIFTCLLVGLILSSCNWYRDSDSIKLDPKAFNAEITKEVQLIDVRTPKEFAQGHIPNALGINYNSENFKDSLRLLDKSKPVYIYCRSGKRSGKSVSEFKEAGFNTIYELEGGLLNWRSEGYKTVAIE